MSNRVFFVIVLVSILRSVLPMCFEPNYRTSNYHRELYAAAPFILVGRVVETKQNNTHQAVKLLVTCVYKAPREKRETMLHQEINFTMEYKKICEPLLRQDQSYFFFFEERLISKKHRRRKKKKKNSASDFTRMSQQKKKYISLGAPIPVPEMDTVALERLVELVKQHGPVGHCYNVWSPWSSCSNKCGVGAMERVYPRHQTQKPNLTQTAVCHNAPCTSPGEGTLPDTAYQYQPISVDHCKSMELVRVRWCTGDCKDPALIRTAVSWEMYPTLMLCVDHIDPTNESLQYHNVAIPHSCGCVRRDAPEQKYAVIETRSGYEQLQQRSSRKRNLKSSNAMKLPI